MLCYLFSRYPVVSQTFCDTEMLALEAAGFRLVAASLNPPPDSFRHERLRGLQAEVLYPPPRPVLDLPLHHSPDDTVWEDMAEMATEQEAAFGKGVKAWTRARNAWHFARALRRRGVRHVHVHFANRATHTALFLTKAGLPYSFTAHAQDFMVDLANDDLLRAMIRGAEFVVAVSDFSRDLLVKVCPDAAEKIVRIYNGIDASVFPAATPAAGGRLEIVSIGRLIDFKGFPVLIDAVAALTQRGVPVRLRIIGGGPCREALAAQTAAAGLTDSVVLCGVLSQEQIKTALASASVFALACRVDGKGASDILPTVILEAMACGLPVVSTTLAGVPEMVVHGVSGLLAPPDDVAALTDHLAALAADPAQRARMGEAGRARVQEVFSLGVTAGALGRMFEQKGTKVAEGEKGGGVAVCLLESWGNAEAALTDDLAVLAADSRALLIAAKSSESPAPPPDNLEFLPDAVVLEAAWRSRPDLVRRAESLRSEAGPVDGEDFYRAARRALHLATQAEGRGWRAIHALRAESVLCAWLLHHLTGLPATAVIEAAHGCSRFGLTKLLAAFTRVSSSDPRLLSPEGMPWPDTFQLAAPPAPKRILGLLKTTPPPAARPDPAPLWRDWLTLS